MDINLRFVTEVPDLSAFKDLMVEYYGAVVPMLEAVGGPSFSAAKVAEDTIEDLGALLPPKGRLVLGWGADGRLLACGSMRRIRPDAVEMKRMFVRPEARGQGIGQRLFDMRMEEARRMGCGSIYADTIKGNRPMLAIYERFGFRYIPRYPENYNPPELEPFLVYLEYRAPGHRLAQPDPAI